jgi:hypothetical protein
VTTARRPDANLIAKLTHALDALHAGPPLRLAILHGSAAAGTSRPGSDLDVAILPGPSGLDAAAESALVAGLAFAGGADVDLVRLDAPLSTLLKWHIAIGGVPLFEAQPGAFARFRAEAASEYIDFAPALAYHGEIFRRRLAAGC